MGTRETRRGHCGPYSEGILWASCYPFLSPAVYCCCCLANVSLPGIGGTVPESKPFFYVNVADIEMLETEVSYVACKYNSFFPSLLLHPKLQSLMGQEVPFRT